MAKRIAVVAGIDAYIDRPLSFCVSDATEVARALASSNYNFDVRLLLDGDTTRRNVREAIDVALAEKPDLFVFSFAGHGDATDLGTYLATIDADAPEDGISLEYLRRVAEVRVGQGQSLFYFLDCCHSGAAPAATGSRPVAPAQTGDIVTELGSLGGSGRIVLAACKDDQFAMEEPQLKHGIFSFYLLLGLVGEAADSHGEVTATGLFDYVSRAFKQSTSQVPVFKGDIAGRLVLGSGFPPVVRAPVPEEALAERERDAKTHLDDFKRIYTEEQRDDDRWASTGFRRATSALESTLRWFDSALKKIPDLSRRPAFSLLHAAALEYRQELGYVKPGLATIGGVALDKLGHGGFGSVWRVRDADGHEQAYKVFHAQDLDNDEKTKRFAHGFQAMQLLDHPRIVRVHEFTECPFGYTMDFINGPNLRKFVGTLTEPADLLSLLLTVAETLAHAHSRTVIHRDVKPENIIMAYGGEVWHPFLTDFDLAWFSTASELTKSELAFAMYYAAPEQRDSPRAPSARAGTVDMFSFGQLSFFVLCTQDPNIDPSKNRTTLQHRLSQGWSAESARRMIDLYVHCTQQDPAARPRQFRDICDELREIRALLQGIDWHARVPLDKLPRELAFAMSGLDARFDAATDQFYSLSGKISIAVEVTGTADGVADIKLTFYCIEPPLMPGLNHDAMRQTLLARLDKIVKDFPRVEKRPGNRSPFEVKVFQYGARLTYAGVEGLTVLTGRVIDLLERSA